jgi:hypothetical protein
VVAVETAFTEAHGARTGAVLTAGEHMQQSPDFRLRMLSQIAAQLDTGQLPENSEMWQVCSGIVKGSCSGFKHLGSFSPLWHGCCDRCDGIIAEACQGQQQQQCCSVPLTLPCAGTAGPQEPAAR